MKVPINPDHCAVTTVLGIEAGFEDLDHHQQSITTARGMEEPKDLSLQNKRTITKTTKRRWEHHALLTEFTEPSYLKDSNYPMISRNMTGPGATIMALRLPTSSKNTRGFERNSNAKLAATPHRRITVMVKQAR
jgi:hypothetical protein